MEELKQYRVVITRPILEVALEPLRKRFTVYVHDKPAEEGPLTEKPLEPGVLW